MGLTKVYPGANPMKWANDAIREDMNRRNICRRRVLLYRDASEELIKEEVRKIFRDPTVQRLLEPFARLAASQNLFKRVVDTISSPIYAVPPVRRLDPEGEQDGFEDLSKQVRLNETMDLAARLLNACNHVFLYTRWIESLQRVVINAITPDMMVVIPHPDDCLTAIAYIYQRQVRSADGKYLSHWVYWDDEITFEINHDGNLASAPVLHGLPAMPFVAIHRRERWAHYWDDTTGEDLVSAAISCAILNLLSIRKLKVQGFNQLVVQGDLPGFPKGQIMDVQSAIVAGPGISVTSLQNEATAENYLTLLDAIKTDAAASRGISRARLNQEKAAGSDDVGLDEERASMVRIMLRAEHDQFEVLKMVYPGLSADAQIANVDFAEVTERTDKKNLLEIWDLMRKMGLRNVLDDVKALNPEIRTDGEATDELARNIAITSKWVEAMRALNMAHDVQAGAPGQNAQQNGAMGPMVRDGMMSRDMAGEMAGESVPDEA